MDVNLKIVNEEISYSPPKMVIVEINELFEKLGPVVSCSGFGGAVTGGC
jgi:hypothetical protein